MIRRGFAARAPSATRRQSAINLFARLRVGGRGRREDVAVHVAAGRERGEQRLVDALDHRAQIGFHDAVKLDALARGDAQRVVAVSRGEIVEHAPLLRRHHAAGNAAADHHDVFLAGLAQVAVVLLIAAVKFQELVVVLAKNGRRSASASVAAMVPASVGIASLISSLCVNLTGASVLINELLE